MIVYREFFEKGNLEDFIRLKMYFERKEVVVVWFKDNSWLYMLLGDYVMWLFRLVCLLFDFFLFYFFIDCVLSLV